MEAIAGDDALLQAEVCSHAAGVRPMLHAKTCDFIEEFMALKRLSGSAAERAMYDKLTVEGFVDRLCSCRPLMFMMGSDSYIRKDQKRGNGGFEYIVHDSNPHPNCIHYQLESP